MAFVPCTVCRRHVDEAASACPFCATPRQHVRQTMRVHPGRFSRAAIFAGLAACYTSTPSADPQTPAREREASEPGDRDGHTTRAPASGAVLRGKLTHAHTGAPLVGVTVEVWTTASVPTTSVTNARGEYEVGGLEPREYQVSFMGPTGERYTAGPIVMVTGPIERKDFSIDPVPQPMAMPYGAPPMRRRTV